MTTVTVGTETYKGYWMVFDKETKEPLSSWYESRNAARSAKKNLYDRAGVVRQVYFVTKG